MIMNDNLAKYSKVFCEIFSANESQLESLKMKESENWDSVGHIALIAALEDVFDISFEFDDMFELSSYKNGILLLSEKYNIEF